RPEEQADEEGRQAGGRRPEGDVPRDVEHAQVRHRVGERRQQVIEHQASSATIRSATMSVRVPRDPLTRTRSPSSSIAATAGAACSLLSKYSTVSRGMPDATAASASALAGGPP